MNETNNKKQVPQYFLKKNTLSELSKNAFSSVMNDKLRVKS